MPLSKIVATSITDDAITSAKIADDAVVAAAIADDAVVAAAIADGAVVSAAFANNAVSTSTLGTVSGTQKFNYTNVSPNQQPINTSFTLSASEAPLGSFVGLRSEVLSGSSAGDQYCYVYQQGGTGFTSANYVGNDWYYYSVDTILYPIRDAGDRTFNVAHGTISYSSSGDVRRVYYMGYLLLDGVLD